MSAAKTGGAKPAEISDRFIRGVTARLSDNKRVRRRLPVWGRVDIDRALPMVCVYRRPRRSEDEGTSKLVTSEAAYVTATGSPAHRDGLSKLVRSIAETMTEQFGAFMVLELWALRNENDRSSIENDGVPGFRIVVPPDRRLDPLAGQFESALKRVKLNRMNAEVAVVRSHRCHPPWMAPLLSPDVLREMKCIVVGLGVRPVYRDASGGQLYPLRLRLLRRQLGRALKRAFFEFSRSYTTHRPKHYHMLGRHAVVKAVWEADHRLGDVADVFDLLLQTTPVNTRQAWNEFHRTRFEKAPHFQYRPVPVDPAILKRRLYAAPLERVEDPALSLLLRQKQTELDRQITMLLDLNTKRFLHESLQLYGGVGDGLATTAVEILERLPSRAREDGGMRHLDAQAFARRAMEEIAWYREKWPSLKAAVEVRSDVNSGLLVSRGTLLVGSHTRVPVSRANALLQHEVGTHVLTYYNGKAQPLRQLYSGLAGYEALQEGLAVLAEYLVGGLSRPRLRLLAARVLVVRMMVDGATFVDCFRTLNGEHGLTQHNAFTVTMRVFRGGGLTKDAIYLRGLDQLLGYLNDDGALDPLFIGKIATEHVPIIKELTWRRVLREAPLRPRYIDQPDAIARLERVRRYESVLDLIKEEYR